MVPLRNYNCVIISYEKYSECMSLEFQLFMNLYICLNHTHVQVLLHVLSNQETVYYIVIILNIYFKYYYVDENFTCFDILTGENCHFICISAFNIKLYKFHDVSFQSGPHEKGCERCLQP